MVEGGVSAVVYMGFVGGREEAIGFIFTEGGKDTDLPRDPTKDTRGLDPDVSPSFAFFACLVFSEGSRVLFWKSGGNSGSQSTWNYVMSTPCLYRSSR